MLLTLEVRNLNPKKDMARRLIPPKTLRSTSDVCVKSLTKIFIFNHCLENSSFPDEIKCVDVISLPNSGPTNSR